MKSSTIPHKLLCSILVVALFYSPVSGFSYYLWSPESGKFVSSESQSQDLSEELFQHASAYQQENKTDRAIEEFQNLIRKFPTAPNASEAQYQIGLIFEERKDYARAVEAYKKVTENYPQSARADTVTERLFKIANLYMTGEKTKVVGVSIGSGFPKAIDIFEHIVKTAPYSAYGDQAQFNVGLTYKKMGRYQSAMEAFQKVIDQYPNSSLIDDARYQVAETSFEYSKRSTQDEKAIDQAVEKISDFLAHYPESSVTEKINALRKEISNRDAEKNYRIGLYYETEKQFESAALYYEDVEKRYPDTEYGKLASKKLESLRAPLEKMKKEQREMAIEMESVGAKLKSLRSEQVSAPDEARAQDLENQIASLKTQQKGLLSDQLQMIRGRESAWRQSEKDWRGKWKAFQAKRKEMKLNHAPELVTAFQKWEKSLLDEKDRISKERETISSLRKELKLEPEPKVAKKKSKKEPVLEVAAEEKSWWQIFKRSKKESANALEALNEEIQGIRAERDRLFRERAEKEREGDQWQSELASLKDRGFEDALGKPWFTKLVSEKKPDLAQTDQVLNRRRLYLSRRIREFEMKKALHIKQFGPAEAERWSLTFSIEGFDADEFIASGVDLTQALRDLQQSKARLADAWIEQKRKVETITHAFTTGAEELPKSKAPMIEAEEEVTPKPSKAQNQKKDVKPKLTTKSARKLKDAPPRILKKRMKFIEREIRQRFDEIEDWNQKKEKSIEELNQLMQGEQAYPTLTKVTNKITAPVRWFFWLGRSLTFGLSDIDRQVIKKAQRKEKANTESAVKIRQLHEQIELESLLIQGRVSEINEFEKELKELKTLAQGRKIEVIPIYTERDFAVGEESLKSAGRIISSDDRDVVLIEKLNEETSKLQAIERDLKIVNGKIAKLSSYEQFSAAQKRAEVKSKEDKIADDFEAESTPASRKEPSAEQLNSGHELDRLKKKIETLGQKYQAEKRAYREELKRFYTEQVEAKSKKGATPEIDHWNEQGNQARHAQERSGAAIEKLKRSELKLLRSEEEWLQKKKKMVEAQLNLAAKSGADQQKSIWVSELESCELELASVKDAMAQLEGK